MAFNFTYGFYVKSTSIIQFHSLRNVEIAPDNSIIVGKSSNKRCRMPDLTIDIDEVSNLRSLGFMCKEITNLLRMSTSFQRGEK